MTLDPTPTAEIDGATRAHDRLAATVVRLQDDPAVLARPSRLPGWTVAHVLVHLARNADSHRRLLDAAASGQVADQYPGGPPARAAEIDQGVSMDAGAILADVRTASIALEAAWAATDRGTWADGRGRLTMQGEAPVRELPFRRWREVEVHHADLGLGYQPADWDRGYVTEELARLVSGLPGRLAVGHTLELVAVDLDTSWTVTGERRDRPPAPPVRIERTGAELVAWLLGRDEPGGAPPVASWQEPAPPGR